MPPNVATYTAALLAVVRSDPLGCQALRRRPQNSDVVKKSRRRFFAVFGFRGPSAGPGSVKKRFRMKNRSWGKGRDLQGPSIEKNTTSDVWVPRSSSSPVLFRLSASSRRRRGCRYRPLLAPPLPRPRPLPALSPHCLFFARPSLHASPRSSRRRRRAIGGFGL